MGLLNAIGIGDIVDEVGKSVRQVLPNKQAQNEFDLAMEEIKDRAAARIHEESIAQQEVNKTEAAHASIFVAGWRPFIGWVCGCALAWNFLFAPMFRSFGFVDTGVLNLDYLITLVLTMLGSAGLRTFEISKGINRDSIKGPRFVSPPSNAKEDVEQAAGNGTPEDLLTEVAPWDRK